MLHRRTAATFLPATVCLLSAAFPAARADETAPAKPRLSRLQGTVAIDRNNDVVGATVLARAQDDASRIYVTSTGDDGEFQIPGLPDGAYDLHLEREGFETLVKRDVSLRFPFRAVVEVAMRRVGLAARPAARQTDGTATGARLSVSGTAFAADDGPLADVELRLMPLSGAGDPFFVESGDDGRFVLDGLAAGLWELAVRGVGYLPIRAELRLEGDAEITAYLVQQPADYLPSPRELMLLEEPLPPEGLEPFAIVPR